MAALIQNSVIILEILKLLNYSYFAGLMTRKSKIGNLTKVTELSISGVKKVVPATLWQEIFATPIIRVFRDLKKIAKTDVNKKVAKN